MAEMGVGEIERSLQRIEAALERIETKVGQHDTEIALLKQTRRDAAWVISGAWMLVVTGVEWFLHGSSR